MNKLFFILSLICIIFQSVHSAATEAETQTEIEEGSTDTHHVGSIATYAVSSRGFDVGKLQTKIIKIDDFFMIESMAIPNKLVSFFTDYQQVDKCRFIVSEHNDIRPQFYETVRTGKGGYSSSISYDFSKMLMSYEDGTEASIPNGYILDNCNFYFAVANSVGSSESKDPILVFDSKERSPREFKISSVSSTNMSTQLGELSTRVVSMVRTDTDNRSITFWLSDKYPNFPIRVKDVRKGKVTLLELENVTEI